jgi:hypothetical protein
MSRAITILLARASAVSLPAAGVAGPALRTGRLRVGGGNARRRS